MSERTRTQSVWPGKQAKTLGAWTYLAVLLMTAVVAPAARAVVPYLVKEINTKASQYVPANDLISLSDVVVFRLGRDMWRTGGTAAGTFVIGPAMADSVLWHDRLWFVVADTDGTDLWSTDGSLAGTRRLPLPQTPVSGDWGDWGRTFSFGDWGRTFSFRIGGRIDPLV